MKSEILVLHAILNLLGLGTQHTINGLQLKVGQRVEDAQVRLTHHVENNVRFVLDQILEYLLYFLVLEHFNLLAAAGFLQNFSYFLWVVQVLNFGS